MTQTPGAAAASSVIPIGSLAPRHRARIAGHLIALEPQDRYLRFGYAATDEHIHRYVDGLDFERDDIFGVYNRELELIAVAHLAFSPEPAHLSCAEFGVSVLKKARGRGYGSRLFERAVVHSRNQGVEMLFVHALSENTAMLKIARKAGASLERAGSETDAYLRLPPATVDSRMSELVQEQMALTDYRLKVQAKSFRDFLAGQQQARQEARAARRRPAG